MKEQVLVYIDHGTHNVFVGNGDVDFAASLKEWAEGCGYKVKIKKAHVKDRNGNGSEHK